MYLMAPPHFLDGSDWGVGLSLLTKKAPADRKLAPVSDEHSMGILRQYRLSKSPLGPSARRSPVSPRVLKFRPNFHLRFARIFLPNGRMLITLRVPRLLCGADAENRE